MRYFLALLPICTTLAMAQGREWQNPLPQVTGLQAVQVIDTNNIVIVGYKGIFLKSTDAGVNWSIGHITDRTVDVLTGVFFVDASVGTVVGTNGTIMRTSDGGHTWSLQKSTTTDPLGDVSFTDPNTGTVVGAYGTILHTTDGGVTWVSQLSGTTNALTGVSFTDANTGNIVGSGIGNTLLRTTDGGSTWKSLTSGVADGLTTICFTDANTGTTVGDNGIILRTTNGGTTWVRQTSGTEETLLGVSFLDNNVGVVVGGRQYGSQEKNVFRTTDGGATWMDNVPGPGHGDLEQIFWDVSLHPSNVGFFIGDTTIYKTTNAGGRWQKLIMAPSIPIAVDIEIDSLNLIVPAEGDTFAYTMTFTNLTSSSQVVDVWTKVLPPKGSPIDPLYGPVTLTLAPFQVVVIDTAKMSVPFDARSGEYSLVAFVGTYQADTLATDTTRFVKLPEVPCSDISQFQARCQPGGTIQTRVILTNDLHTGDRVEFTIDDVPYEATVGRNRRALLSLTGFSPGSHDVELTEPPGCYPPVVVTCPAGLGKDDGDLWDDDASWEVPTTTTLLDNYPDPFNPSTTIQYELSQDAQVTLKVYNMLGQVVATLVDEPQTAGYRSVLWNGRNDSGASVASGIYIYRMTTGNFVQTKRMLLLK